MATFRSPDIYKARRARAVHDGLLHSVSSTIVIPSGTLLASADVIRMFRAEVGKILPTRVIVDVGGNLDGHATLGSRTLTGTLGYLKSADRSGTNLSFTYDTTTGLLTSTAATEDDDALLQAATTPIVAGSVTSVTNFGATAGVGQLASGGIAVYNNLLVAANSMGRIQSSSIQNIGYNANVMDIAITMTANSSTATTMDVPIMVTLEYFGISATPGSVAPYIYKDRYSAGSTGSF